MEFQEQLIGLLQATILGLLNIGAGYLIYYVSQLVVKAKAENAKNQNAEQKKLIDNAIDRLNDLVVKSVTATQLTLGESIKQAVADNKVDKTELVALKDKVLIDVQSQLTTDGKEALSLEIDDLNSYISNLIEVQLGTIQGKVQQ